MSKDLLQALFNQVDEIYTKTKNGELSSVEDMGENVVGITDSFYIFAEPSVEPNAYSYITDNLNIRMTRENLYEQAIVYINTVGLYYNQLMSYKHSERIRNAISANISNLEDVKDMGKGSR